MCVQHRGYREFDQICYETFISLYMTEKVSKNKYLMKNQ